MKRLVAVILALVMFSTASFTQDEPEEGAYFSISTNRTWAPGQKPAISVWGRNIRVLEFRVYRVNDPVKFFQTIQDAHSFGGRAPQVPHVTNWIESFHSWKHSVWADVRDFFRAQFTPASRTQIRDWMLNRNRVPVQKGDTYAQVPVLNRQQLVATWRESVAQKESWETATVQVPVTDRGVYLVEATNGKLRAYTIVMINQIALVTKTSPGHVLAFVADRKTGAPIAGAQVMIWSKNSAATTSKTDADGLADATISEQKPDSVTVIAQVKGDFTVNTPGTYWMRSDSDASLTGYVYTDRPVYRPGDTVHYKIIVRSRQHGVYQLPPTKPLTVEVRDATYKVVSRATPSPSADFGTIKGEYVVPPDASLGNYQLEVSSDQVRGTGSFYIEEYKKPEYDVRVTPEAKRVLEGTPIHATIEARYFFGEPVAGAKVTWVLHKWRYWAWDYEQEDEGMGGGGEEGGDAQAEPYQESSGYGGEQESEQHGVLDADGRLKIEIPTTPDPAKNDYTYRIEARVTDPSNREITGHGYVLGTYGSFYLQLRPNTYVYQAGGQAQITVEAFDYDKRPISTAFELKVDEEHNPPPATTVFTASGHTDANGHAVVTVPVSKAGWFVATARATTPENRQIESRTWLWVTSNSAGWGWPASAQVKIVPDQKTYKPGDTAHVLVLTGGQAHVLLTTEGSDLYSRRVLSTTGSSITVDVPVLPAYSPNFYVSAVFLRDNEEHQGQKSISVPPDAHKLQVQIQPSKPQYQPGEAASYTIKAADNTGHPVAAEFSLGVVDEAIYSIHPESATDILKEFYGSTYNTVGTETSLTYYFHGEAGHRQMQLTDVRRSRALAQIKPERLVQPKVRKAFPDTAYWVADVKTDSSGTAQVRFDFPDALTAWRATARGVTKDTKVGSDVGKVIVRKNVMVRLAVPRFFRHDDEVTIGVLVHNYLTDAKTARVSLEVKGLTVIDGATRDVQVPSRGEVTVNWRVKAQKTTQATLLAKALTDVESDAMEITLPVEPYGVKQSIAKSGSLGDGSTQREETIAFPAAAEATSRKLELSVTPSVAGAVFGALEYLTAYPYGCTEQTMSSFLPNIVVAQAVKDLGLKTNLDQAELNKKIRAGIERLYTFQHDDGGWGWWQTDDTHVFMTAYVLAGLSEAKRAGYDVKDDVLAKARGWLAEKFKSDPKIVPDLRAYMSYALAEAGDNSSIAAVWDQRNDLSPYGAALLGLAMFDANDTRANQLAPQIERAAKSNNEEAWWEQKRDPMLDFTEDITPEATAYIMKFLTHAHPDSPLLPKAGVWLVTHRDEGWWWESTKQTAFVIYGLTDYLKQSGELKPDYSVEVELNGKVVLSKRFTPADALLLDRPVIRLDASQITDANKIVVRKKGSGRLYWSARADYWSDEKRLVNQGSYSLSVAREYYKLTSTKQDNKIVYDMSRLSGPLHTGDIVAVRLTVTGSEWKYLLIEDPIPAGAEFIEKDEFYQLKGNIPSWWTRWYTRREYHDDRVAMFHTYFNHGAEYVYLLKVVNPGMFRVSPARVQPMYQTEYQATSDGQTVEVK